MPKTDQMSREELLAAHKQVTLQIKRLSYGGYRTGLGTSTGVRDSKIQLMSELQSILAEIEAELVERGSKHA